MADSAVRLLPDCKVSVAGKKLEVGEDARLTRIGVDLDADLFGQCVLVFHDPKLALIDGKQLECGAAIDVELGFQSKLKKVFHGEVVAHEPLFRRDLPPGLKVVCFETLHRLALSQSTRSLNDVDDKEIASRIAREHGLTAEAPAGTKETVQQSNVSDAVFLKRRAARSGNTLRIEDKKLIIGPPTSGAEVPIVPGEGLRKIKVRIASNAQVGEVSVHGWDPKAKREITFRAKPQGSQKGPKDHGGSTTLSIAGAVTPADTATAEAIAKGRLRGIAERFIQAEGEVIGNPDIVPGSVLKLDKLGAGIDGDYRVEHAAHAFDKHGYRVSFRAVRIADKKPPAAKPAKDSSAREQTDRFDIEIQLVDAQDRPQVDMAYELTLPDGKKVSNFTGAEGIIRATSTKKGDAKLELFPGRKRPPPPPAPRKLPDGALLVELQVVDSAGKPLPARAFELLLPDGRVARGRTDADGFIRARSAMEGEMKLNLPESDPEEKK